MCVILPLLGCGPALAPGTPFVRALDVQPTSQPTVDPTPVEDKLATQTSSLFGGKKAFDEAKVAADSQRIATYFAERGFFEADVRSEVHADGEARDVRWLVTPGPMTRIVEVRLLGDEQLDAETRVTVQTALTRLDPGERYDFDVYDKMKAMLEALLDARGYPYSRVAGRVFVDKKRAEAIVEYTLAPGPLVFFGPVAVTGNGDVPEHAVLREVLWREGQRYDPELLSATETALYRLGVFSLVRVTLPDPRNEPASMQAQATLPVTVSVEVAKLSSLSLGGGIGLENRRHEVRARAEWRLRNFFGGMRTLELSLRPGYAVIPVVWIPNRHGPLGEASITFTQPDLARSGVDLFVSPSYQLGIQEAYQFHGPGVRIGFERPVWRRHIKPGMAWNLEYYSFFNIDENLFVTAFTPTGLGGIGVAGRAYRLAFLEEYVSLDLRDNILDPSRGMFAELRSEQGGKFLGGQFDYIKLTPEIRGYFPLGSRVVLAARVLFGVIWPLGGDSPITRRYRMGGASNHRGFSVGRLSPQVESRPRTKSDGVQTDGQRNTTAPQDPFPIGANAEFLFSFDVRVRLVKIIGYWLSGTAFVDAGDAPASLSALNFRYLHWAVGPSLSFDTPIGSIRAGLGIRLNRLSRDTAGMPNPDPERRFAFQLSIGAAF